MNIDPLVKTFSLNLTSKFLFQIILCLFAVIACTLAAPGLTYYRTVPEEYFDASYVKDTRVPGGFAYSSFEGPRVSAVAPVYRNIVQSGAILRTPTLPVVAPVAAPLVARYGPLPEYYGGFAYNSARYV